VATASATISRSRRFRDPGAFPFVAMPVVSLRPARKQGVCKF
jgi:hypothetical protein